MSLIDRSVDQVYLCKYNIPGLYFSVGDKTLEIGPTNIVSVEKIDDFEFAIRSIIKVSLSVDIRQKIWIIRNRKDVVCKFELDKVGYDVDRSSIILGPETVWNTTFSVFLNDSDNSIDTALLEGSIEQDKEEAQFENLQNENFYESQNIFDVYLFNKELYNASIREYNAVITSGVMQDIVAHILSSTKHKNVLMSPIQNSDLYQELLIPKNDAYKALIFLDQNYGFYEHGASIFYDVDTLYIINANGKVTAAMDDEWTETTFLISATTAATPGNGSVIKPNQKINYINITEECINPQNTSFSKDMTYGNSATVVVTDDIAIDECTTENDSMDETHDFTRYISKYDNKYTAKMMKVRMEENTAIMYISGDNLDINAFKLNKTYKLVFDDATKQERYGKFRYRITHAYHAMKSESDSTLISSHQIVLKKCSDI